jgi:hypothetical protein
MEMVRNAGGDVRHNAGVRSFVVDDIMSIAIKVVRCRWTQTRPPGWDLRVGTASPDITVAARIDDEVKILDYYLFPKSAFKESGACIRLASENRIRYGAYRFKTLKPLLSLISRVKEQVNKKPGPTMTMLGRKPRERNRRHKQLK